jgi:hypothetical protein
MRRMLRRGQRVPAPVTIHMRDTAQQRRTHRQMVIAAQYAVRGKCRRHDSSMAIQCHIDIGTMSSAILTIARLSAAAHGPTTSDALTLTRNAAQTAAGSPRPPPQPLAPHHSTATTAHATPLTAAARRSDRRGDPHRSWRRTPSARVAPGGGGRSSDADACMRYGVTRPDCLAASLPLHVCVLCTGAGLHSTDDCTTLQSQLCGLLWALWPDGVQRTSAAAHAAAVTMVTVGCGAAGNVREWRHPRGSASTQQPHIAHRVRVVAGVGAPQLSRSQFWRNAAVPPACAVRVTIHRGARRHGPSRPGPGTTSAPPRHQAPRAMHLLRCPQAGRPPVCRSVKGTGGASTDTPVTA